MAIFFSTTDKQIEYHNPPPSKTVIGACVYYCIDINSTPLKKEINLISKWFKSPLSIFMGLLTIFS